MKKIIIEQAEIILALIMIFCILALIVHFGNKAYKPEIKYERSKAGEIIAPAQD